MIYKIGDFYINWLDSNFNIINDEYMGLFEANECENKSDLINYRTEYADLEKNGKYKQLRYTSLSELYETERGKMLIYHWATCRFAIGYWLEDLDKEEIVCYINPDMLNQIPVDANWFFSIAGLHRVLLKRQAPILHASYIDWNGRSILFTAPSQTGKSTQSRLWTEAENVEIINDDRVLLRKKDGVWNSYGYPSCGSSKICLNRTLPIEAIVVLEQGEENRVEEMTFSQKVRALVSGTEVYVWDIDEIDMSFKIAEQIAKEVLIVKLVCRPDYEAVSVLKEYLLERRG